MSRDLAAVRAAAQENARRVTFQGTEGAYSHIAARRFFGERDGMEYVGKATFAAALAEAEEGRAGFAFLPIENTTAGAINDTYDLLRATDLSIVGEEVLPVRHALLAVAETPLSAVERVLSHPQALAQCGKFLASLPNARAVAFVDTAEAAKHVAGERDPRAAAIASEEAGRLYGLTVLARGVADQDENWTRFVLVSALSPARDPSLPWKTSLVLATAHRLGALARCLNVLADHGRNLTKLESRPMPREPFRYLFYLDFEGSLAEPEAAAAVRLLESECSYLKVLGSYPKARIRS